MLLGENIEQDGTEELCYVYLMSCFEVEELKFISSRARGHAHLNVYWNLLAERSCVAVQGAHGLRVTHIYRSETEVESVLQRQPLHLLQHGGHSL